MICNINDFKEFNSKAAQKAVEYCSENGGGTVVIPNGVHHTGPIHLRSNICLHLEDNAELVFSDKKEDYLPPVFTRWEGTECYNYSPLIYANGCSNISITGHGTIIGSGEPWWKWKRPQRAAAKELCHAEHNGVPVEKRVYGTEEAALRPSFIQPINCTNVLLEDFTIKDGPQWTIHPVYCQDVVVRNVNVETTGPNTDGLNPDSCKNVLIEGCTFSTGDDCVAINSGINEDGQRVGIPCENIEIRNCTMKCGHGAIVIGSAMSGGVKNVYVHDCVSDGADRGIRLKSMRGRGGYVHNVRMENITINNASEQAIQISMFYESSTVVPISEEPSDFDNIVIENVKGTNNNTGIQIKGLPEHKLGTVVLKNIDIEADNLFECSDISDIRMDNVKLRLNAGKEFE